MNFLLLSELTFKEPLGWIVVGCICLVWTMVILANKKP